MARSAAAGWSRESSPFHAGERAIQERVGVRSRMERAGRRMLLDFLPDGHRAFYEQLPFVVGGTVDDAGRVWASMLVGIPGFVESPDELTLDIAALPSREDPFGEGLRVGAPIGLLGIELSTRTRARANGVVTRVDNGGFSFAVGQAFGNCPKYIHPRTEAFVSESPRIGAPLSVTTEGAAPSERAASLIATADTFFIASTSANARAGHDMKGVEGVDVSHRGGPRGFVRVVRDPAGTALVVPDYRGNSMFNTLGNVQENPRVGLLFVDFDDGSLLSLSGSAEIVWEGPDVDHAGGAERAMRIRLQGGVLLRGVLPLRFRDIEAEPGDE